MSDDPRDSPQYRFAMDAYNYGARAAGILAGIDPDRLDDNGRLLYALTLAVAGVALIGVEIRESVSVSADVRHVD
jgi:hypothetical protein